MDDEDLSVEETENVALVEAVPWHNSDTVAASFAFAAQISAAAASHFQNLAFLALGQSAHEWAEDDREEFAEETVTDLMKLAETKETDG